MASRCARLFIWGLYSVAADSSGKQIMALIQKHRAPTMCSRMRLSENCCEDLGSLLLYTVIKVLNSWKSRFGCGYVEMWSEETQNKHLWENPHGTIWQKIDKINRQVVYSLWKNHLRFVSIWPSLHWGNVTQLSVFCVYCAAKQAGDTVQIHNSNKSLVNNITWAIFCHRHTVTHCQWRLSGIMT